MVIGLYTAADICIHHTVVAVRTDVVAQYDDINAELVRFSKSDGI